MSRGCPLFDRLSEGALTALPSILRAPGNTRRKAPSWYISAFSSGASGLVRGRLDATERQDRGCGGVDAKMHTIGTDRRPKNFAFEDAEGGGVARLRLQSCQVAGQSGSRAAPRWLLDFEQVFERVLRTIRACQSAFRTSGRGPDGSSGPSWSVLQTFACFSTGTEEPSNDSST